MAAAKKTSKKVRRCLAVCAALQSDSQGRGCLSIYPTTQKSPSSKTKSRKTVTKNTSPIKAKGTTELTQSSRVDAKIFAVMRMGHSKWRVSE